MINSTVMNEGAGGTELMTVSISKTEQQAMNIVKRHALMCGAVGIIPIPLFDQVTIGALLAKMLHDICAVYNVKWTEHQVKTIVTAILGGAHSQWIPSYVLHLAHLSQGALLVGMTFARPLTSAGLAYALGSWFVSHFESGAWVRNKEPKWF